MRHSEPRAGHALLSRHMKIVLLLGFLLVAGIAYAIGARQRIAREQAAASARARAARRPKVPAVSSNLKGVTASQTIQPFVRGGNKAQGGNEHTR